MSGKSELRIFDNHPPQVVIESAIFQDIYPSTALSADLSAIDFLIQGSQNEYLDLNDTILSLRLKILETTRVAGGANIAANDPAGPVPSNYFLNTLFSDIQLSLNDVPIEGGENMYPYKATIESALNFNRHAKEFQLLPAGFSAQEDVRQGWCAESKTFDIVGSLRLDFFNQPKYLIPGINVRLRLTPAQSKFCLNFHSGAADGDKQHKAYKLIFSSAMLYVRRVRVSPSVERGHKFGLQSKNAIYPYTRSKINNISVAAGTTSFVKENIFSNSLLPKLVVIGFVHGEGFSGNYDHDPIKFEPFNVSFVNLYRDGQGIPYKRGYNQNFDGDEFTDSYTRSILQNMQLLNSSNNNGIDMDDFKGNGYTFFTFNLTPDFDFTQPQVVRDSNLRLEVRFHQALAQGINIIAYATYDANIQISKDHQIKTDVYS